MPSAKVFFDLLFDPRKYIDHFPNISGFLDTRV